MQKQCRICNKKHKFNLKGILSYPKHLLFGTIPNYFRRMTQKLNEKQTQQVSLSDTHICYIINKDICDECWTFMYQGFQCQKCNTYNYHCTQEIKICFLCKAVYCRKCFRRVDLFSQNGLCTFCQFHQSDSANSTRQLFSLFFAFMFPCLAFKYLASKLVKTFEKIQYTQSQKIICVSSFVIMFPLIYCICLIGFGILLIAKVIKSIILLLKKYYIQKRVAE
ncbi:unnamed protein product [Paramecium octaurelia]|uniref:Phorbol-ester/DAG-type domain-containing protein n=1 Tax=Paramecium octaurelia TaxID=43137 RepID=A0A8S1XZB9_PAROT|nr:unnamed protein product [Paramecium octaurelia]